MTKVKSLRPLFVSWALVAVALGTACAGDDAIVGRENGDLSGEDEQPQEEDTIDETSDPQDEKPVDEPGCPEDEPDCDEVTPPPGDEQGAAWLSVEYSFGGGPTSTSYKVTADGKATKTVYRVDDKQSEVTTLDLTPEEFAFIDMTAKSKDLQARVVEKRLGCELGIEDAYSDFAIELEGGARLYERDVWGCTDGDEPSDNPVSVMFFMLAE